MSQPSAPAAGIGGGAAVPPAGAGTTDRFAGLADRPVAEHVEVFAQEHDRLRAELGTIDRL